MITNCFFFLVRSYSKVLWNNNKKRSSTISETVVASPGLFGLSLARDNMVQTPLQAYILAYDIKFFLKIEANFFTGYFCIFLLCALYRILSWNHESLSNIFVLGYFCIILLCLSRFVLSARFFFFVRRAKYYETGLQRGAQRFPKLQ